MAQRLYAAGMINQVRWANAPPVKMSSVPMNLPQLANGRAPLARHASTPTLNINRPGILRQANSSSPGLAIHVQSMKKSAFKMLCKSNLNLITWCHCVFINGKPLHQSNFL